MILPYTFIMIILSCEGAQWLSGRLLDLRPKGHGF